METSRVATAQRMDAVLLLLVGLVSGSMCSILLAATVSTDCSALRIDTATADWNVRGGGNLADFHAVAFSRWA